MSGNIIAASTTLASRTHHVILMTVTAVGGRFCGRSGMGYSLATVVASS